MYSYEIDQIMEQVNSHIGSDTYIDIIRTSPQINHIVYHPYGSYYEMWSEDGGYWRFTVYMSKGDDISDN